jgi:hypothetical protein
MSVSLSGGKSVDRCTINCSDNYRTLQTSLPNYGYVCERNAEGGKSTNMSRRMWAPACGLWWRSKCMMIPSTKGTKNPQSKRIRTSTGSVRPSSCSSHRLWFGLERQLRDDMVFVECFGIAHKWLSLRVKVRRFVPEPSKDPMRTSNRKRLRHRPWVRVCGSLETADEQWHRRSRERVYLCSDRTCSRVALGSKTCIAYQEALRADSGFREWFKALSMFFEPCF